MKTTADSRRNEASPTECGEIDDRNLALALMLDDDVAFHGFRSWQLVVY